MNNYLTVDFPWLLPIESRILSERIQSKQKANVICSHTHTHKKLHYEVILYSFLLLILWLYNAGSQSEAKSQQKGKIKVESLFTEHAPIQEKNYFFSKTLGFLASIEILCLPLASPWLSFVRSQLESKAFLTKIVKFSRPNFLHLGMRFLLQ